MINEVTSIYNYEKIPQEKAKEMMDKESVTILDVRTPEEFRSGHIPGAICIPNETIGTEEIPQLPDKDRTILVYCRSGQRSQNASLKLVRLGYTAVKDFGGIIDWKYEKERG